MPAAFEDLWFCRFENSIIHVESRHGTIVHELRENVQFVAAQ